jgi:hypothetical protein
MLGGLYGLVYFVAMSAHARLMYSLNEWALENSFVSVGHFNAFVGLVIGFAVGVGIKINEKVFGKFR